MGWIRHHAIVVTGDNENLIEIHRKAREIFPHVSGLVPSMRNGDSSFLIPPDGSKEGWETSNSFNEKRDEFIKYLEELTLLVRWVEIAYGECNATVTRSNS